MGEHDQHAKDRLRRRLRAARARVSEGALHSLSSEVCARVVALPAFRAAAHVVAYAPTGGEIDPAALVTAAIATGRAVYYPRVRGNDLEFLRSTPAELVPGAWGVPEPEAGEALSPTAEQICFLVPGVAFDRQGARLGRGLGCYDRALGRYRAAVRIGLACEMQLVPVVPVEAWDISMHAVVTETEVYVVGHADSPALKENRP
jgi:5-formyltetrahydrofolate cyclo-ligase